MRTVNKSSGLKGVTLKVNGNNKYWFARVQGRINISRRFPFTDEGKKMAYSFYKKTISENKDRYYNYKLTNEAAT